MTPDILIRGGLIVDGTGAEPRRGDLAIAGGRISAVGLVKGRGRRDRERQLRNVSTGRPGQPHEALISYFICTTM